jgi:hypothetical protein
VSASTVVVVVAALLILYLAIRSRTELDRHPGVGRARRRCPTGKVAFASRRDADHVVYRSQASRGNGYDKPLQRSYRCPHCGAWHTTSQRKRSHW